jgi:UDP-N-acetylmuramate--alanine ligase
LINLNNIQSVYFLGIGGIGMSALARYFLQQNKTVSGYDKTPSALTQQLVQEGATLHTDDTINEFPKQVDLIVYTPAVPQEHPAMQYYTAQQMPLYKRSDVLQAITLPLQTLAVAGTHGKTTTSSMLAHIFKTAQQTAHTFLGGIAANYNLNYWAGTTNFAVVEADEYDRSFLKLQPTAAIVTSMDPDHLDIYGTAENMQEAFHLFLDKVLPEGNIVHKLGLPLHKRNSKANYFSYHLNDATANCYASDIKIKEGVFNFNAHILGNVWPMQMATGGRYNIENAIAAATIAYTAGIEPAAIVAAVNSFAGVKRRFEYVVKNNQHVFVDDYAHHPSELQVAIQAAKELYPNKKCLVVFQPHLYSRTKDLYKDFAQSLSIADEVVLLPIYPARELPIEGVNSELIASNIKIPVQVLEKQEYLNFIKSTKPSFLLSTGAGDIDLLNETIKEILN